MMQTQEQLALSLKAKMIESLIDWCYEENLTPYVMVRVDQACRVPTEFVNEGGIVFDLTAEAINRLEITPEKLSFQARFGEDNRIHDVYVPINRIQAALPLEHQALGLGWEVKETQINVENSEKKPTRPTRIK